MAHWSAYWTVKKPEAGKRYWWCTKTETGYQYIGPDAHPQKEWTNTDWSRTVVFDNVLRSHEAIPELPPPPLPDTEETWQNPVAILTNEVAKRDLEIASLKQTLHKLTSVFGDVGDPLR